MPTRPEPIFTFGKLLMANHVHAVPGKRLLISRLMVLLLGSVVSLGLYHYSADHQRQKATFEMKLVAQDRALGVAGRAQQLLTITNSLRSLVANQPDLRKKNIRGSGGCLSQSLPGNSLDRLGSLSKRTTTGRIES